MISYRISQSKLGNLLLAATEKGLCAVRLGEDGKKLEREFKRDFPAAERSPENKKLNGWSRTMLDYLAGNGPWPLLPCDPQGTAFQRRVWTWLRTVEPGETPCYSDGAKAIGRPAAARAVARACAANPVALAIPCHRIVPKSGGVGGYRWDPRRKRRLLELERSFYSLPFSKLTHYPPSEILEKQPGI